MEMSKKERVFLNLNFAMLVMTLTLFYFCRAVFLPIAVVWLALAVAEWNWRERYRTLRDNSMLIWAGAMLFFYLLYLVGPLFSENVGTAISQWEYKIWFLVCPVCVMPMLPKLHKRRIMLMLLVYALVTFVIALCCMSSSLWWFMQTGYTHHFFYEHAALLPYFSLGHPSYCSMYEIVAWMVMAEMVRRPDVLKDLKFPKILAVIILVVLPVHIYLLQSKMGIATFAIVALTYLVVWMNYPKRHVVPTVILLAAIVAGCGFFIKSHYGEPTVDSDNRIANSVTNFKSADRDDPRESTAIRIALWKNTWELGREHWFWGVGSGDVLDGLHAKAVEHHYRYMSSGKFNCHNQYLQTWLGIGIPGLACMLWFLCHPLWVGFRKRSLPTVLSVMVISANILVECMLEVYAGLAFIPFALTLALYLSQTKPYGETSGKRSPEVLPSASCG